jgi:hypothetical protein
MDLTRRPTARPTTPARILRQITRCGGLALPLLAVTAHAEQVPPGLEGVLSAYSVVGGDQVLAKLVSHDYPKRAAEIAAAQRSFDAKYPQIKQRIEFTLTQMLGKDYVKGLQNTLASATEKQYSSFKKDPAIADAVISTLKMHAQGKIDSPALQYMLIIQYADHPEQEMKQGHVQHYQADGAKAQGLKLQLDLPLSWRATTLSQGHTVQQWQSENGTGTAKITLQIFEPSGKALTAAEQKLYVSSGRDRAALAADASYLASNTLTIAGHAGTWIKYTQNYPKATPPLHSAKVLYQLNPEGKAITIACETSDALGNAPTTDADLDNLLPLCQQVISSVRLR